MEPVSTLACLVKPVLTLLKKLVNINCGSISAVVIPRHAGKSSFVSTVSSKEFILLDVEENIKMNLSPEENLRLNSLVGNSSWALHYYPIVRDYVIKTQNNHKNKKIVILCSDLELIKYLNIKNVLSFVPSNTLSENIKNSLDEATKLVYEASRMDILINTDVKKITSYADFGQLSNALISKFKLQQRL
jgi:hypothetical protein